jgi:hypothetical protein
VIFSGFAAAAVGSTFIPGVAAGCGTTPYAAHWCSVRYTAAAVAFGQSLENYSECVEKLPENRALQAYYMTPLGARSLDFALGSGNVTGNLSTFTSQFSTPSYILQQLRDQYNANHPASVPTSFVISGPMIGIGRPPVTSVPAGGGGRSQTNFIDFILEKLLQVPKQ